MTIGIDAHNLEGQRTGVGRYLISLLQQWDKFDLPEDLPHQQTGLKFILYFKKEIPKDLNLPDLIFEKKILKSLLGLKSNSFFIHYLLPKAAKEDGADILFCPGYVAPLFYRGKIALALHDIIYEAMPKLYGWPSFMDKILLKKISKISAKKAEMIFTCSEFSKSEILKYYRVDPNKVFVIPLAADDDFRSVYDEEKVNRIKEKYKIKDKFIFFIGSIFNRRHLKEAIQAFVRVAPKLPDYQFLIVGVNHTNPFVNIDGLVENINKERGEEIIIRRDYLSGRDLAVLYGASDLLIWLSDYEGFGLPILESMASGTIVITSPTASIPEVAGDSAIFVKDPKNIDEISQSIYRGLTDEGLRKKLIKGGLEQAKKFSWGHCAKETLGRLGAFL